MRYPVHVYKNGEWIKAGYVDTDLATVVPLKVGWTEPEDPTLQQELSDLLNRNSAENGSNTPDFILAEYLLNCLRAFNEATVRRSEWYGEPATSKPIVIDPQTPQSEGTNAAD